jgi:2-dehydro-3-deoxygluconokinase
MAYDLIALGETMIALAPPAGVSLRHAELWRVDHAGAESNTCVGLARLGLSVAWVSRLGADTAGDRILDALSTEQVDTRWVRRDPDRPTGLMVKEPEVGVRYYRTGSAASALSPDDLAGVPVADARAVLVSGVTALIGPQPHAAGLALLRRARGLRIVDPNLREGLWGSGRRRELVLPFLDACDLLFAGSQELAELLDGPHDDLRRLAELAKARGVGESVVRGPHAIGVLERDGSWTTFDIRRDAAVDPIGAGDAFNAGYIAVRLKAGSIGDAVTAGVRCGAAVTRAVSDTEAFPRSIG